MRNSREAIPAIASHITWPTALAREREELQRRHALLTSLQSGANLAEDPTLSQRLLIQRLALDRASPASLAQLQRPYSSRLGEIPDYNDVYRRLTATDLPMNLDLVLHQLRLQQQREQNLLTHPATLGQIDRFGTFAAPPSPLERQSLQGQPFFIGQQPPQDALLDLLRNTPGSSRFQPLGTSSLQGLSGSAMFPLDPAIPSSQQPSFPLSETWRQRALSSAMAQQDESALHQRSGETIREEVPAHLIWPQPAALLDDGFPRQLPALLAQVEDRHKLSAHQVLLRHQIEAFQATNDDVATHTRGRNKPITLKQGTLAVVWIVSALTHSPYQ